MRGNTPLVNNEETAGVSFGARGTTKEAGPVSLTGHRFHKGRLLDVLVDARLQQLQVKFIHDIVYRRKAHSCCEFYSSTYISGEKVTTELHISWICQMREYVATRGRF